MIDLCLLGTGGMVPMPGRFLTSLHIRHQGNCYLIDCGESTQVALRKFNCSISGIEGIWITHLHADHILGIPGLLSTMGNEGRRRPLHIYGPVGISEMIQSLCKAITLVFPVTCTEFPKEGYTFTQGDFIVESFPLKHRIPCYGYKVTLPRSPEFIPEKAEALKIPKIYWSKLQRGETVEVGPDKFYPHQVLGEERKGLSFVYGTDTRPTDAFIRMGKDSAIMILEGMYGEDEMLSQAIEKYHMLSSEAARIAKEAQTKKLWLTHYSPSFRNQSETLPQIQKIFPNAHFCKDGEKTTLRFEK